MLGKTPDFLVPPEEQADVRAAMAKLLQGEHGDSQPLTYENPLTDQGRPQAALVWTNSSIKDAHGEVSSIICTGQDVTEVRAEEGAEPLCWTSCKFWPARTTGYRPFLHSENSLYAFAM